jgi:cytochrome c-type biogenesis protein CcmH
MTQNKLMQVLQFWLLSLSLLGLLMWHMTSQAQAQEPSLDDIDRVASQINCPTCRGISLANCPTTTCEQWRAQIADLLKQGYTDQQVLDYFSTRYGQQVLQEPPRQGVTLWLWILPFIALALAAGGLMYTMRRWRVNTPIVPTTNPLSDDYLSQVEQDLRRGN